ncbi:MAG: hypothetical protein AAGD25_19305 [Cyanobacteria bacterium P01_F01_bin.150]
MITVDSLHVRMMWDIVDSHRYVFNRLSDEAICLWILKSIKDQIYLSHDELKELEAYVSSRTSLIRDVASFQ